MTASKVTYSVTCKFNNSFSLKVCVGIWTKEVHRFTGDSPAAHRFIRENLAMAEDCANLICTKEFFDHTLSVATESKLFNYEVSR
jgi:hypothetical protein